MKKYSRVLSLLSLENINKVKLVSEASQENFALLTTIYEKIAKLELLVFPKVGDTNQLVPPPPSLLKVRGHMTPLPLLLRPCWI